MKCYRVDLNECEWCYVLAETGSKASWAAIKNYCAWSGISWEADWWRDVRRRRVPELDGDYLTEAQVLQAKLMWSKCPNCEKRFGMVGWGDNREYIAPYVDENDRMFCDHSCRDELAVRVPGHPAIKNPATRYGPGEMFFLSTEI